MGRFLRYQDLDTPTKRLIVAYRDATLKRDAVHAIYDEVKTQLEAAEKALDEASAALSKEWEGRGEMNRFILGDMTLGLDPDYYKRAGCPDSGDEG